nr:MAG TPA: hypothetical protein [Caudoviricetes sp.]
MEEKQKCGCHSMQGSYSLRAAWTSEWRGLEAILRL